MKRLLSLLLSLSLLTTTALAMDTHSGLKDAIDELNYALEVEWDQYDMGFYQDEMRKFQEKVEKLSLDKEDRKELLLETLSHLPESSYRRDVMEVVSLLQPEELTWPRMQNILAELAKRSDSQGASWSGRNSAESAIVVGVILIIMVVIISKDRRSHRDGYATIPPYTQEPDVDPDMHVAPNYGCDYYPGCEKY